MELQRNYTAEEVLEIVNTLPKKDKEIVRSTLFMEEAQFEKLVMEDFAKYEETFRALA